MPSDSGAGPDRRTPVGRSLDRGLGALQAFREAFGESVEEARERGELTTDRAKEILNRTIERVREGGGSAGGSESESGEEPAPEEAVSRVEFDALRERIERIEAALGLAKKEGLGRPHDGGDRA